MPLRILTGAEVTRLLPMARCITAMEEALAALAAGTASQPLRLMLRLPGEMGVFGVMPAVTDGPGGFGLKAISVYPGNEGTRYDSHQGAVLLFEPRHGTLAAILDATAVTAIRTAAVSAVATKLLANPGPADLALLGSGVQARTHLEAMHVVRPLQRVRVWSPNADRRRAFVEWAQRHVGIGVEPLDSPQAAVTGASLICTVSASKTPILASEWVSRGTHVNAVGSSRPETRELDGDLIVRARLFTDRRESLLNEAGDFLIPRASGLITDGHLLGELGDLLLDRVAGRAADTDVTVFKSLGLAVEDVAAASLVHAEAERLGVGTVVELGGVRE
jgi:ornithine cyclodeaminase